jgi:uncharacterized protein (DUF362 family)
MGAYAALSLCGCRSASIPRARIWDPLNVTRVAVAHGTDVAGYPVAGPFDPDSAYPEYAYGLAVADSGNGAYRLVREALRLLHPEGFGLPDWNPLAAIIRPGDTVLIKPNLVDDVGWEQYRITHPSVLRAVIDYACKACGPSGHVLVGDGPYMVGIWERVIQASGIRAMVERLGGERSAPVRLVNLNSATKETARFVDLGQDSALAGVDRSWWDARARPLQSVDDRPATSYRIAPAVLDADVVISVPKAKVHTTAGVTLAMKNLVGIIPCLPDAEGLARNKDCAHLSDWDVRYRRRGQYVDNDTIWRTVADLNRILLYADRDGRMRAEPQRRYLAVVDGILAGEFSQSHPRPAALGTVVAGTDPVAVDAVASRVMGFDPRRIRTVARGGEDARLSLGTADPAQIGVLTSGGDDLSAVFRKSLEPETQVYSWKGAIEAEDFDAPEISDAAWNPRTGELAVRVKDAAGAVCVRATYRSGSRIGTVDLGLERGTPMHGEWRGRLEEGIAADGVTFAATDFLFNTACRQVTEAEFRSL